MASDRRRRCPCDSRPCATPASSARPTRAIAASASSRVRPAARVANRTFSVTVRSSYAYVSWPDHADGAADRAPVAREVVAEHDDASRPHREQARAQAQQRGLARTVRAREQHDVAGVDLEVGAGERGEATEEAHRRLQADDAAGNAHGPPFAARGQTAKVYEGCPVTSEPSPRVSAAARIGILPIVRRAIAAVGRLLVTVGLLILLFVAFQLWGTGIVAARAQDDLRREFEAAQQAASTTTTPSTEPTPTTTTLPPLPPLGDGIGVIQIPKIGVDKIFVEGTGREDLKKGPGHYPGTPLPGEIGNAAIAGHRTTYGQPFYDLDKLAPGDEIITQTLTGRYTYKVRETLIVKPEDIVRRRQHARCATDPHDLQPEVPGQGTAGRESRPRAGEVRDPRRLRAFHTGEGDTPAPPVALADSLEGETQPLGPAYGWGAIVAVVGLAWWWMFRRWPHPLRGSPVSSRSSSCSSGSTSSSNASSPRGTDGRRVVRGRAGCGDAHRAVRAPHAGAHEHDARRVDGCDAVPQVRAPATHRRVQVPRRDERRAVARRRRCPPRRRRALVGQPCRRARAAPRRRAGSRPSSSCRTRCAR